MKRTIGILVFAGMLQLSFSGCDNSAPTDADVADSAVLDAGDDASTSDSGGAVVDAAVDAQPDAAATDVVSVFLERVAEATEAYCNCDPPPAPYPTVEECIAGQAFDGECLRREYTGEAHRAQLECTIPSIERLTACYRTAACDFTQYDDCGVEFQASSAACPSSGGPSCRP